MGFSKFLETVLRTKAGGRRGVKVGGSQDRLRPGAALLTLPRFPGSPHPPPSRVFCAAGRDGVDLLEGREQQPERAVGVSAATAGKATSTAEPDERETNSHTDCLDTGISQLFWDIFLTFCYTLTTGAIKRKNPAVLLPILLLNFVFSYQYDMGYGTLLQSIEGEEENMLDTQSTLLELPKGPLTYKDLEKIRISQSKFFIEK